MRFVQNRIGLPCPAGVPPQVCQYANPAAWSFPWQYAPPQATDWGTVLSGTIGAMLADAVALAQMVQGRLPAYDPTKIDWSVLLNTPLWSNPAIIQKVTHDIASAQPSAEYFLQRGAQCGLFNRSFAEIQAAWMAYMTTSVDPCGAGPAPGPLPPLPIPPNPLPPLPIPPVQPPTPPAAAAKKDNTTLVLVGVVVAGVVGGLALYAISKRSGVHT